MKFTFGALCSLLLTSSAAAFGPKPLVLPKTTKAASADASSLLWRPPMNMAAGGAERAYQDEYYEGTRVLVVVLSSVVCVTIWLTYLLFAFYACIA